MTYTTNTFKYKECSTYRYQSIQ